MVLEKPYTQFCDVTYQTVESIKAGSEMYTSYGDDTWFNTRRIQLAPDLPSNVISVTELEQGSAQCLSHLYAEQSEIPMAGMGVYSKASYDEGDVVYISPVLVLPKQQVRKYEDTNVLTNYIISEDGSDVALLPIGLTGILNHGGTESNVRMEWYTGEGDVSRLDMSPEDLEALPFAPLDIRYVATRPISRGEELLLDYGEDWSRKWLEHVDRLVTWNDRFGEQSNNLFMKPQFREPIGAPAGFFPEHFKSDCIGKVSCKESPSLKRRKAFAAMDKRRKLNELYEASRASVLEGMSAEEKSSSEL
jgi:hypothetical protein